MHAIPSPNPIPIPPELTALARLFGQAGATLYAVGGLPRNAQLTIPPSDMDICSALRPDQVEALCREHDIKCIQKAPQFGTSELHMNGLKFEHTTFRGDAYGPGGTHRPEAVEFTSSLEADAFRRDFTCNALYADILSGELFDPTGGLADIQARIVRATSPDPAQILRDDGLRVLRLVRFACELGFSIEERTWDAACENVSGLADIAWERKRDELLKILLSDVRYPVLTESLPNAVLRGIALLYDMGAFPYLIPELLEGDGIAQRPQYHAHDVMRHNFHACAAAPATVTMRLAGLLHDVGKPAALREKGLPIDAGGHVQTPEGLLPHGKTPMLNHDTLGVPIAREILQRMRIPNAMMEDVLFLVEHHMYDLNLRARESTLRARFADIGYERALLLCAIREADVRGSGLSPAFRAVRWRAVLDAMKKDGAPFSQSELRCTGRDIMEWLNLPPGEQVGLVKHRLLLHCARHPQDNTPERLSRIAGGMLHEKPKKKE